MFTPSQRSIRHRRFGRALAGLPAISLALVALAALAGCGNGASAASAAKTATVAPCRTPGAAGSFTTVRGTVATAGASSATVTVSGGSTVQVTYTSKTTFSQTRTIGLAGVQTGMQAVAVVTAQPTSSSAPVTAESVSIRASGSGGAGFGGNSGAGTGGFSGRCRPTGTPVTGQGQAQRRPTLRGTVTNVNTAQSQLTLEDANGNDYLVSVPASAPVTSVTQASAADVKAGATVLVAGVKASANAQDVQATTVQINPVAGTNGGANGPGAGQGA